MRVFRLAQMAQMALAALAATSLHATAPDPAALKKMAALSVPFVPNAGQWDAKAAFAAQTFAGTLFVTKQGELVYSLPGKPIAAVPTSAGGEEIAALLKSQRGGVKAAEQRGPGWSLTETLIDHTGKPRSMAASTLQAPAGFRPMQASVSYLIGNDETKHAKALNTYERVNLGDMYPGINVQLRATGNNIEKIFTVAPQQDATQINIQLAGAARLEIGDQGELIAHTGNGPVTFTAPIAFQESASGERTPVAVAYTLNPATKATHTTDATHAPPASYSFRLGDYDRSQPLVIDPLLRSTYLGAAGIDYANALAIHPATGEVYVAGQTTSTTTTFPGVSGGAQGSSGGLFDAFVSRFSADLTTLIKSTYLGAAGDDFANALAIHPATGEIYVAGRTTSTTTTFPGVSGGAQGSAGGGSVDAFVSRFSADLTTLIKSTYLGAAGNDRAYALAIHPATGEVYVAGQTTSTTTTFPGVNGGAQGSFGGGSYDAFVSRFSADLTATDTTPAAFAFAIQTNVPVLSQRTSNPAQITGVVGAANIYVSGAFGSRYCISSANNCSCDVSAQFVSTPGTITNNSYVCVRHVSAPIANRVVESVLHVGGAAASFVSATGTLFTSCNLDIDGSGGAPNAVTDGLMLVRAMLGFTGTAVTNGAIIGTPPRNTWPLIRGYLNGNCGTNFLP